MQNCWVKKQALRWMRLLRTSSNAAGTAGGLGIHPSESWVVWVCACVFSLVLALINHPSAGRGEQWMWGAGGGLQHPLCSIFTLLSNAQTDRYTVLPAGFFDARRYRCVMMSYGRERGWGGMIKGEREGWRRRRGYPRQQRDKDGDCFCNGTSTGVQTFGSPIWTLDV